MDQLVHDGIHIAALIVAVAMLKVDVRWIRDWCKQHKEDDDKNFERINEDIRQLRGPRL